MCVCVCVCVFVCVCDFLKICFVMGGRLLYNVGFFCIRMHISHNYTTITSILSTPPLPPPYPSWPSQSARLGSLCSTAASHQLSVLHMAVYMCRCYFLHACRPLLPLLCPQVHCLRLCLHSFPADRFIYTISLGFIHMVNILYLFSSF